MSPQGKQGLLQTLLARRAQIPKKGARSASKDYCKPCWRVGLRSWKCEPLLCFPCREYTADGDFESLEQLRRGVVAWLVDAVDLVALARQRQDGNRFHFRIDDPVFGNLCLGIYAT